MARVRADKKLVKPALKFQSNIHTGENSYDRRGVRKSDRKVVVASDYNTKVIKQYGRLVR